MMIGLCSAHVLLVLSYVSNSRCGYIVPVFNSVQGDQGYSYPNLASELSTATTASPNELENESFVSKNGRSQAVNEDYWLGNPAFHRYSKV